MADSAGAYVALERQEYVAGESCMVLHMAGESWEYLNEVGCQHDQLDAEIPLDPDPHCPLHVCMC